VTYDTTQHRVTVDLDHAVYVPGVGRRVGKQQVFPEGGCHADTVFPSFDECLAFVKTHANLNNPRIYQRREDGFWREVG